LFSVIEQDNKDFVKILLSAPAERVSMDAIALSAPKKSAPDDIA